MPYGPSADAFDLDGVASAAMQQDPALAHGAAVALATEAYGLLVAIGSADAPELARALLRSNPSLGVSEINAVAKATVDFFEGS